MPASLALIGVGPRGVATAARLVDDHRAIAGEVPLHVHLIDAVAVGAGRTWRTDQSRYLLNNTYCAETTAFADESVPTVGPVTAGLSLAEWVEHVGAHPDAFTPEVVDEASQARAWSFPSRRLQGAYYRWALDEVIARAGDDIRFTEHIATVIGLDDEPDGAQRITLADGTELVVDAVVLAQGLLTGSADTETHTLAAQAREHGWVYVAPGMPSERDWDALPAGERVIVRGLGANFFDLLGVLFEGRGGRFTRADDGRLHYVASGREPIVSAGSRRGLPYRSKSYYPEGLPPAVELPRFSAQRERELRAVHAGRGDIDAGAELLPEIYADFEDVFAEVAARTGSDEVFDWERLVFPTAGREFADQAAWDRFVDGYLSDEHGRLWHPDSSPTKAVHRAMETARRRLARLVLAQVIDPVSVVRDLKRRLLPEGLVLASGPPPERVERLIALREAGLVEILGPGLEVSIDADGVHARTAVPGQQRTAHALAEARMKLGNLRNGDDPLIAHLLGTGQARFHRVAGELDTDTLDVTTDRFLLVDAAGRAHERRVVLGPPAGDVQWYSAIGAVPGTGDKLLAGADLAAAHVLSVAARAAVAAEPA